jgi:hypothetical protein
MNDQDIESLLRRYRPVAEISKFSDFQISKSVRTWPWAVAAAALLVITIGLHATVVSPPTDSIAQDARRVQILTEELGGTRESQAVAEWLAIREARAEQERLARAASPPAQDRQ